MLQAGWHSAVWRGRRKRINAPSNVVDIPDEAVVSSGQVLLTWTSGTRVVWQSNYEVRGRVGLIRKWELRIRVWRV